MKKIALALVFCMAVGLLFTIAYAERTGREIYEKSCGLCHNTGLAGAPKFGDNAWLELEKKEGIAGLVESAKKGKNAMPPKGSCVDCTDAELKSTIQHMIDSARPKK